MYSEYITVGPALPKGLFRNYIFITNYFNPKCKMGYVAQTNTRLFRANSCQNRPTRCGSACCRHALSHMCFCGCCDYRTVLHLSCPSSAAVRRNAKTTVSGEESSTQFPLHCNLPFFVTFAFHPPCVFSATTCQATNMKRSRIDDPENPVLEPTSRSKS